MKKIILTSLFFALLTLISSCSVLEGRPEEDNLNQAKGSDVWWETRQSYELNSDQLNDEFGDQPGDANDARPTGINPDGQDFRSL